MFTFKEEAWRAGLQGVLDGLDLAGHHAEDLCLNAAAAQSGHSSFALLFLTLICSTSWLIKEMRQEPTAYALKLVETAPCATLHQSTEDAPHRFVVKPLTCQATSSLLRVL